MGNLGATSIVARRRFLTADASRGRRPGLVNQTHQPISFFPSTACLQRSLPWS